MTKTKRFFSNWVAAFEAAHQETEIPAKFIYWAAIGTVAGALERKVYYDGVRFRLYPNHFLTFTGPPAIKKSTTVNLGIDHLRALETVNVGPSAVTWQNLVDKLVALNWGKLDDIKDGSQMKSDTAPMTLPAPELGTLVDFSNRDFLDFMCVLWDSPKMHEKSTRGMGDQMIYGPCVNLMAGTTPEWIRENVKPSMFKTGLLTRFIFVYSNDIRTPIAWPEDVVNPGYEEALKRLDYDLSLIHKLKGAVTISPEAKKRGKAYYDGVVLGAKNLSDYTKDWASRKHVHVIKLALCISCAKRDNLTITLEDYEEAITKIESAHQDLYTVLSYMEERKELGPQRTILTYIQNNSPIAVTKIYSTFHTLMLRKEIDMAIDSLVMGGSIEKYPDLTTATMHIRSK